MDIIDNDILLDEYADEMGLGVSLTLPELIASHKRIKEELDKPRKEWREELSRVSASVKQLTMDNTWIKIESLREMSVRELVDLIGTDI